MLAHHVCIIHSCHPSLIEAATEGIAGICFVKVNHATPAGMSEGRSCPLSGSWRPGEGMADAWTGYRRRQERPERTMGSLGDEIAANILSRRQSGKVHACHTT